MQTPEALLLCADLHGAAQERPLTFYMWGVCLITPFKSFLNPASTVMTGRGWSFHPRREGSPVPVAHRESCCDFNTGTPPGRVWHYLGITLVIVKHVLVNGS